MRLCDPILTIYQNEIKRGNYPLYVSTPSFVDASAKADLYVLMKYKLDTYCIDGLEDMVYRTYQFPSERGYYCPATRQCITGPFEQDQAIWYQYGRFDIPTPDVCATRQNIYIRDGVYAKNMVPTLQLD